MTWRLKGPLDEAALEAAIRGVVLRHEVLRTTFVAEAGQPFQVIAPPGEWKLSVIDARDVEPSRREAHALDLVMQEVRRPFDLERGPLFRVRLVRLGDEDAILSAVIHHAILDEASIAILTRELGQLYRACRAGQAAVLPDLPVQYADYAAWQHEVLGSGALDRELAYWKAQLEGAPDLLSFPTDAPRPPFAGTEGATCSVVIDAQLHDRLEALAASTQTTTFMILLAAWATLLHRYAGQSRVVVGVPVAGRGRSEIENVIGFFINTLALPVDLSGDPSFRELLERVRTTSVGGLDHRDFPFDRLVHEISPGQSLRHHPIFQAMFALQTDVAAKLELDGVDATSIRFSNETAFVDLLLHVLLGEREIVARLTYRVDLFRESTVRRMAAHLRHLLAAVSRDPEMRSSEVPLLDEAERRHMVSELAGGSVAGGADAPLTAQALFERQAAQTPSATAVVFEGRALTYAELDARANRLAHRLARAGVGLESVVGICLRRGIDMVVAVLGVLKAGGAYVPLDPDYPLDRLRVMLEDSGAAAVLGGAASHPGGTPSLLVEDGEDAPAEASDRPPGVPVAADFVAYVIYTSGSTGRPKGVAMTHGALVNMLLAQRTQSRAGQPLRTLQYASLSFDVSFQEMFSTWMVGGTLVLVENSIRRDPFALLAFMEAQRIQRLFVPFAALSSLAEAAADGDVGSALVEIVTAGEQLQLTPGVRRWLRAIGQASLYNQYGPSETHLATYFAVRDEEGTPLPPIGRPIANARVYVLDGSLRPVPVGVPGECFIGGLAPGRGYWRRPEWTAERFLPDPFGLPGSRMYRTGDRVRWLENGNLEFLGRLDDQVKVRGFRIEPGEIEVALSRHPRVKEAVVTIRSDASGSKALVAYVVPARGAGAPAIQELRDHLRKLLPEYMVPAAWSILDALPLLPSGKVHRAALPAVVERADEATRSFVAPRTPAEELVAAIWADLLGLERVGATDDFFEIGGHSLNAAQVVSRVRHTLKVESTVRQLFEQPTLARYVACLGPGHARDKPIEVVAHEGAQRLSFSEERMWFVWRLAPSNVAYNLAVSTPLEGALDHGALRAAVAALVDRHESLRTAFALTDEGLPVRRVLPAGSGPGLVERSVPPRSLDAFLEAEAGRPFDLSGGPPPFRATLVECGDRAWVLQLCMHHIVTDGWSIEVILRDLGELYRAHRAGRAPSLPALRIGYGAYAEWQRGRLTGELLARNVEYWRGRLADAPAVLDLPTDRPRGAVQTDEGARHSFRIPARLVEAVTGLSRRHGVTPYMTMLAVWQTLLRRYSGQSRVVVGSPVAGRVRAELEPVVGLFINMLAMDTDVSGNPSFVELLARVREGCLGAYAHDELPFDKLVDELNVERTLAHHPVFQVAFVLQSAPPASLVLEGATTRPVPGRLRAAIFDLGLFVVAEGRGWTANIDYRADLFDAATVRRMAAHLERLLEEIVARPETRIDHLRILAAAERNSLVATVPWHEAPKDACLHETFAAQAAKTPEAVALVSGDEQLTYRELDERADAVAAGLRRLGVGPEQVVAVCLERSPAWVVAMLGVLKAGGIYVPIAVDDPAKRRALLLEEARPKVVLTRERFDALVASPAPDAESRVATPPESGAWVIYTSGSTGRPKGVVVSHRSATHQLAAWQALHPVGPQDAILVSSAISFDLSILQVLWPVLAGGRMVLIDEDGHRDPAVLAGAIRRHGIARLVLVPSMLRMVLAEAEREALPSLQAVFVGGEALPLDLARDVHRIVPHAELFNVYGPTEATILATAWPCPRDPSRILIGKPVPGTSAYVLDAALEPVPHGVPGVLYLGGPAVARGYLGRPEVTAETFVPDPFSSGVPGARLYRTGDTARRHPSGDIEFLGRADHQVKLRGFRIELGEIEAALAQSGNIGETVVLVRGAETGRARLVAYVTPVRGTAPAPKQIQDYLRERLPAYMVPTAYVVMDRLPRFASGKIDVASLPMPVMERLSLEEDRPRTRNEQLLADIWRDVLGLESVSVADNFFDSGGDSILAIRLVARANREGLAFTPQHVFVCKTLAELASVAMVDATKVLADQSLVTGTVPATPIQRWVHDAGSVDRHHFHPSAMLDAHRRPGESAPLSYEQQRLWFFEELSPGANAYILAMGLRIAGPLDRAAFDRTIAEIVRRHDILRTIFPSADGIPVQVVLPAPAESTLPVVDLGLIAESERDAEIARWIAEEHDRAFDLHAEPSFRVLLLSLGPHDHVLIVTMHHIITDGWSTAVFARELVSLYGAFRAGKPSPLAPLPIQYADYALWQRSREGDSSLDVQLAYWTDHLAGAPSLDLPADRPRPSVPTFRGGIERLFVQKDVLDTLKQVGLQEGCTLFVTLLAAFKVLLFRYTGQRDIVVGSLVTGRRREEHDELIGFFANPAALRTRLDGRLSFRALLHAVKETVVGLFANQDIPFERILDAVRPERTLSRSPLFQVMFVLGHDRSLAEPGSDLVLSRVPVPASSKEEFDVSAFVEVQQDGLRGVFRYSADLFDATTIRRMVGHFEQLCRSIGGSPDQPIAELGMLRDEERREILEASRGHRHARADALVCALFEHQAARTPSTVAVEMETSALSYDELNRRANQLAHHLRRLGIGPEVRVGLAIDRSLEMVVGLLAVLKAGGAYVPLDPTFPRDRLAFMMADSRARLLLTVSRLTAALPAQAARVLCLDTQWPASEPDQDPAPLATLENAAYVIYTSGSTGKPKGVVVRHAGLVNYTLAAIDRFSMRSTDRVLQFASISWDTSAEEIYPTLTSGGTLVLRTDAMIETPTSFLECCRRWRLTVLNLPTAYWHELVGDAGCLPSTVRLIIIGGERAARDRIAAWLRSAPADSLLVNTYGATEATAVSTACELREGGVAEVVPIGRPIANVQTFILDADMQLVPVGVPGQLFIGGSGLARGYLDRPALTADRFVPDPFSDSAGATLYRTGDIVRRQPDGNIVYVGRADRQIKLRGVRIELGEVEELLRTHPAVRDAVAVAREEDGAEARLVGYVIPEAGETVDVDDVRRLLKDKVPDYLVPSAVVVLERLPLTPTGKIDVRALPAPKRARAEAKPVAARGPVEEMIMAAWASVLRLDHIDPDANFFTLGGHSLHATQVISRIRAAFKVDLPLRAMFQEQTAVGLAKVVEGLMSKGRSDRPELRPVARGAESPASFSQERMWFLDQLAPGRSTYNIPIALHMRGVLDVRALERGLCSIVERHEALRTTFRDCEGVPVQVISPVAPVRVAVVDLRGASHRGEDDALRQARQEGERPFDLQRGPLFRATLFQLADATHLLVVTVHHIVFDGWSTAILVRELAACYTALVEGTPPSLPGPAIQFSDHALWQRQWMRGELLDAEVLYWRRALAGVTPLELPTDRPRPPVQGFRGAAHRISLSPELTKRLRDLSRQEGVTLFMTLLAAFQTLLQRYSGQSDIAVGSPVANRNRVEVEGVIGFFVNTLVLRTDFSGAPTARELLRAVRDMTLGAYEHQDVPFEKLVEELQPQRDLSRNPLFQVMFALQNVPHTELVLPGLTVDLKTVTTGSAKVDLALMMAETGDRLAGVIEYATDLFDAATIERMAAHWEVILEGIVEAPDRRVAHISILARSERQRLVATVPWHAAPKDACLHDTFAAQVAKTPGAVALVSRDEQLTYRELDERADAVAAGLRRLGVGPEQVVAVCLERSPAWVVAMLGVLKAGGIYVPIAVDDPPKRRALLLEEARPKVVLTRERFDALVGSPAPDAESRVATPPDSGAWLIYTSGSTGRPKGVVVSHRSATHQLAAWQALHPMGPQDTILVSSTISFDLSILQVLWPLLAGGRMVLIDEDGHRDPAVLAGAIRRHGIAKLVLVPSMMRMVLAEVEREALPSLQAVFVGGEALALDLARDVHRVLPHAELINVYGPTEATILATAWPCPRDPSRILIGKPVPGTSAYVLDAALEPVPDGVPGVLYLGGPAVARGYLGRPEVTAEMFVPDPFSSGVPGARLYRTGDTARRHPSGDIEFLGRADHQVKLRGFRIELGEIERALAEHPGVRDAVASVRDDGPTGQRLVAHVVPRIENEVPAADELRQHLRSLLPEYMIPSAWVPVATLPLAPNGKVDRNALPPAPRAAVETAAVDEARSPLQSRIAAIWAELLGLATVGIHDNFFDLGGHSLLLVRLRQRLQVELQRDFTILELLRYPTVHAFAAFAEIGGSPPPRAQGPGRGPGARRRASAQHPETSERPMRSSAPPEDDTPGRIAIIGFALRLPGARNEAELWSALASSTRTITAFSEEELVARGVPREVVSQPTYVRACGVVPGADLFDAEFFGFTPRDAQLTDPQQRVFLECAHEALESAACDPDRTRDRIGVFAGAGISTYLLGNRDALASPAALGGVAEFLTTRLSYKLNLRGPSLTVFTACSTSLVAVHLACQSLLSGECGVALAGGASISASQDRGYVYQEGGILSPDGHCRVFDAHARGTVESGGVAVVVLKPLAAALRDGDPIRAVIAASAINNDGADRIGFTAPSVQGQADVISDALAVAGVSPRQITYVEAHGTGTKLGDPIEMAALTEAFRRGTQDRGFCAIGSIKSNIGHADTAAGVAGLIKTVLALEHRQIPQTVDFSTPNPAIDFERSPFRPAQRLMDWTTDQLPRRAGVSSFGIGGTNAHVVVEEAPAPRSTTGGRPTQLVLLSAKSSAALQEASIQLAAWLGRTPACDLADVAYTLQVGRRILPHRRALVCSDTSDAIAKLESTTAGHVAVTESRSEEVVFAFPGQGAQYPGMARELYEREPRFREELDGCFEALQRVCGMDLRAMFRGDQRVDEETAASALAQTAVAQPMVFAVEYALARLWLSWGVRPAAMIGHSLGEYVAACVAQVLTLDDAIGLVAARGRLMQALPPGVMIAVAACVDDVQPLLPPEVAVAALNAPSATVLSGAPEAIGRIRDRLAERGIDCRPVPTSHAFHSAMMDAMLPAFEAEVLRRRLSPPQIPFVSGVTGSWIRDEEATDARYWVRHVREPVRFAHGLETVLEGRRVLLEVGPGETLTSLARQNPRVARSTALVPSLAHRASGVPEVTSVLTAAGRLWLAGASLDFDPLHGEGTRRRLVLPTYPFQRRRYWLDAPATATTAAATTADPHPPADERRTDVPFVAPAGEIEDRLAAIWRTDFGIATVGAADDFFDLGGTSLTATHMLSRVRAVLGAGIELADLLEARTIRALAQRAVSARRPSPGAAAPARQAARSEWMPFDAGRRRALRLFCFPYAGGGAHIYHSWIDALGDDVEVCPIELPGRGTRFSTTPATDAERLLTELHDVLRPLTEDAYAIVGQSMGSLLASAVAQRLRSSGAKPPAALIVAASPPPFRSAQPSVDATMSDDAMIASLASTDDEAPRELVEHGELRRLLVPTLRADLELSDRLLALEGPPLSCPIVAFAGRGDPLVSPAQMAAWASATTERFELVALTGGHFVLRARWSEVLPVLRRVLGDAIRGSPGHRAS